MKRLKSLLSLSLFTFIYLIFQAEALLLDLYSEKDRHGLSIRVDISDNECSNMPVSWGSRASSINTLGSCVQLYDEPFCKGSLTVIQPFHTIHQMDMSLINFANRIQSASACGPKIKTARYVIQNAADATVLTVTSKYGGFARATTVNTTKVVAKAQQWDVMERDNSDYTLKPREFGDNFPVTFDEEALKNGKIKRKVWKLMSVGRGRYLIKNHPTQRCLYKTEENRVEEHDCRVWSPNQEWVFREIFGNQEEPKKSTAAVGPGLNYNILSKVASYRPPTKPPPQQYQIFHNVSTLAQLKRHTTAAPYQVRKKIKRGPRPKSKPIDLLSQIRPPGLLRPALPLKVSNNNNFLLLKTPGKPSKAKPEFIPSDDHIEAFAYYQQILQAQAEADKKPPLPPTKKTTPAPKKKKVKDEEEDSEEEDDEYQDEDSEEEQNDEPGPIEIIDKPLSSSTKQNNTENVSSPWFFKKVYSKVKTGLGSMALPLPKIPFISSSKTTESKNTTHPHGEEDRDYSQYEYQFYPPQGPPPEGYSGPRPKGQRNPNRPKRKPSGYGLRKPKRPSRTTTTTTTKRPPLWSSIFG